MPSLTVFCWVVWIPVRQFEGTEVPGVVSYPEAAWWSRWCCCRGRNPARCELWSGSRRWSRESEGWWSQCWSRCTRSSHCPRLSPEGHRGRWWRLRCCVLCVVWVRSTLHVCGVSLSAPCRSIWAGTPGCLRWVGPAEATTEWWSLGLGSAGASWELYWELWGTTDDDVWAGLKIKIPQSHPTAFEHWFCWSDSDHMGAVS